MEAIRYLYKTTFKNQVKKSVKKPVTVLYCILVIAYFVWMFITFQNMVEKTGIGMTEGFVAIVSMFTVFFMPVNLITFAKRKGLVFKKSDVHLMFVAPIAPKSVLVYAYIRNLIMSFIIGLITVPLGVIWFHIPLYKMILYFLVSQVLENTLEISLMIILYGNERLSERTLACLRKGLLLFIAAIVVIAIVLFVQYDKSLAFVEPFFGSAYLQFVPIIGWSIACYRLLFLGATTVNVICTCLYILSAIVLLICAYRMKCVGLFYEDAMKYADDYEVARERSKKGEVAFVGGKKAKLKASTITYKGNYGKAIFYRQLLEYKKKRFFIFGFYNLLCLGIGVLIAFLAKDAEVREKALVITAGAGAYCTLIFAGSSMKWLKELENPYTYLIPDSSIRKLWYATLMEHIRSLVNGVLIVAPVAIVSRMNIGAVVLSIVCYVCLQANKLYLSVLCEALLGNTVGAIGKQLLRMIGWCACAGAGIWVLIFFNRYVTMEVAFLGMVLVEIVITAVIAIGASVLFRKMEM
ncbi:putative ABC exporter domain-containing protein [Anaerosporobacter sp.]|uniref:putative ABC exporter domain-containing protein n=1 Tax=Anaerosporobacter sp. TaxID=1872529 RepID=UPI00286F54A5|nr:putative ABC exporter domain-containing protein [Anaerosporobacter sp.]